MNSQESADAKLDEALERTGARDPREFYREQLKALRESDTTAYEEAVTYYRETLITSIAQGAADPLPAWTAYGLRLAELAHSGRAVAIDTTGRSKAYDAFEANALVLHLPDEKRARALLVQLPPQPSRAQRATYAWLVAGRNKLSEADGA